MLHRTSEQRRSDGMLVAERCASVSMILPPWKRPFSMKMLPVWRPATAPPATNRLGTLVSNVSAFICGASVSGSQATPARRISSVSGR